MSPLERCISCSKKLGESVAFQSALFDGLHCVDCRKVGMKPISSESREFAERFSAKLNELSFEAGEDGALKEFRETLLNWIELHTERKLFAREMLETN